MDDGGGEGGIDGLGDGATFGRWRMMLVVAQWSTYLEVRTKGGYSQRVDSAEFGAAKQQPTRAKQLPKPAAAIGGTMRQSERASAGLGQSDVRVSKLAELAGTRLDVVHLPNHVRTGDLSRQERQQPAAAVGGRQQAGSGTGSGPRSPVRS